MAISLPRSLVEFILLGPTNDRRQLQDSPILGDVWIAYGNDPDGAVELLITPDREQPAGAVAIAIDKKLKHRVAPTPNIAPLHNIVAARLKFEDVFRVVMPMTKWWHEKQIQSQYESFRKEAENANRLNSVISAVVKLARQWSTKEDSTREIDFAAELLPAFDRYIALSGLVLWAANKKPRKGKEFTKDEMLAELGKVPNQGIHDEVQKCLAWIEKSGASDTLVFQISRNRPAMPAVARSVPAVKADAARTLFKVNCSKLAWAVIDAGIKGDHDAFKDAKGVSRVKRAFDFSRIRKIVSLDNLRPSAKTVDRIKDLLSDDLLQKPTRRDAELMLKRLADDAGNRRPIHWDLVRPFVEIKPDTRPTSDHGTHVAGIIGANKDGGLAPPSAAGTGKAKGKTPAVNPDRGDFADGMCPDIQLYDFRVLSSDVVETEFAIIAALQFIRYLNARTDYMTIHGANLSLSIPHDVRNYACGRTPVCIECERLVDSGVVVVAAAGNLGYQSFNTRDGSYEGYAAFSITDPGNADGVLTVRSTHRYAPHTYGVSFFSSRGPTGDGRLKPDLVAPGERIKGPYREGWGDLDGTSMAAPHVSGAAAMLMARNTELVGQPRRIKQVLCKSATDLGRETSFQGNGMLDVLRAFQSI